jgi:hypothetical protein
MRNYLEPVGGCELYQPYEDQKSDFPLLDWYVFFFRNFNVALTLRMD